MAVCSACGHDNPAANKFCAECGAPLGVLARPSVEERKVVTSLFCDLVGFTASSEAADPEDVDRMLAAYSAVAQAQIEGHGGVMEKFIGDAVVGVFGAPVAHEDDPERAVRAGLRIVEGAAELEGVGGAPLRLRVGINTGEALVHLGASAGLGERLLVGDAINTAARIQSVAPEMGVAVGLATYEATAAVFDYEELPPSALKGKAEPVRVFHAKASRAQFGADLTRKHEGPFVGREIDLAILKGIFDRSVAAREELFTAWRRFLEGIAERHPTVLVFEDLHWADEAMLAFLEQLADLAEGVPLLLVGTTRPELYERHPDYAIRLRNAKRISLAPLSQDEIARLVSALLDATVLPAELQQPILDRAGGNPLYAEEFVRLLKDRDLLVRKGPSWELKADAEVPFPESVQALIAARLDTLEPDAKSLLADAAVIGKVFWAGGVAAMGERELQTVTSTLRELSRKELVRPARQSSMTGEAEYAFWHVLARDVAYNQLPRASRANRHMAAATWIESKAPERVEDLADVLAYHYTSALDLAQAAGETEQSEELEGPALRFLGLAGERALGLDTAAALASFERALTLTPVGHPERAAALARFGEAVHHAGRLTEAKAALEEAISGFQAAGDVRGAAGAMDTLSLVLRRLADPGWAELPVAAVALLEPLEPGPELVAALTEVAAAGALQGRYETGVAYAERALTLAEELGLPRPARALGYRGLARSGLGDRGGLDDLREAITLAIEAGQGREVAVLHNNLGFYLSAVEGPIASLEVMRAGIAFAQARGLADIADATKGSTLDQLYDSGALDEALKTATEIAHNSE